MVLDEFVRRFAVSGQESVVPSGEYSVANLLAANAQVGEKVREQL